MTFQPIRLRCAFPFDLAPPRHIALVGNFPPRRCGLATYTHDSRAALLASAPAPRVDLYAMDDGRVGDYAGEVAMLVPEADPAAYARAADAIVASGAEVAWIQHEFGIFGGEAGAYLLTLVNRLDIPLVVTFHTVLERPTRAQGQVMEALLARADRVVVMAEKGRALLIEVYGADPARIDVVAHGVPDRPLEPASAAKARLGLDLRPLLLTFGLLSPDKGIADMIEALPAVRSACPEVRYVVLGATHPNLAGGTEFRAELAGRVAELGLADSVDFVDRFVAQDELLDWLAAADVYVTPYRNPAQITSGTLSYAVALGKPVVATPYVHAAEILAGGAGVLVPFGDCAALGGAVAKLLADPVTRECVGAAAYALGRTMTWDRNAAAMLRAMAQAQADFAPPAERSPPRVQLGPLERMSDGTGLLQHSLYGVADRAHGYCIDDNARALMLMAIADDLPRERRLALATTYASFVQSAWNPEAGRFRNFMGYARHWLESEGSADSNGRALWAIGVTGRDAPSANLRRWASELFDRAQGCVAPGQFPRSSAFALLGAAALCQAHPSPAARTRLADHAEWLAALAAANADPEWRWFEPVLSYDNARLPQALLVAGRTLGRGDLVRQGLDTLEWLAARTLNAEGEFRPVGTLSFGERFAEPAPFDQQPLEAWAMIDACAAAHAVTGAAVWLERARAARDWFLGANLIRQPLIDPLTGECHDGLTPFGLNLNHGAESILAWQFAQRGYLRLAADQRADPPRRAEEDAAQAA